MLLRFDPGEGDPLVDLRELAVHGLVGPDGGQPVFEALADAAPALQVLRHEFVYDE
jgi:hypothetical protein